MTTDPCSDLGKRRETIMSIHIIVSSSEKEVWVVVTMVIYPLPLVWERRWVVVVMGIWESEGEMIMLIHMPSPSEKWKHCVQYRSQKKNMCVGMLWL